MPEFATELVDVVIVDKLYRSGALHNIASKGAEGSVIATFESHGGGLASYIRRKGAPDVNSIILLDDDANPVMDGSLMYAIDLGTGRIKCHVCSKVDSNKAGRIGDVEIVNKGLNSEGELYFGGERLYVNGRYSNKKVKFRMSGGRMSSIVVLADDGQIIHEEIMGRNAAAELLARECGITFLDMSDGRRFVTYNALMDGLYKFYLESVDNGVDAKAIRDALQKRICVLSDPGTYFFFGAELKINAQRRMKAELSALWEYITRPRNGDIGEKIMALTRNFGANCERIGKEPRAADALPAGLLSEIENLRSANIRAAPPQAPEASAATVSAEPGKSFSDYTTWGDGPDTGNQDWVPPEDAPPSEAKTENGDRHQLSPAGRPSAGYPEGTRGDADDGSVRHQMREDERARRDRTAPQVFDEFKDAVRAFLKNRAHGKPAEGPDQRYADALRVMSLFRELYAIDHVVAERWSGRHKSEWGEVMACLESATADSRFMERLAVSGENTGGELPAGPFSARPASDATHDALKEADRIHAENMKRENIPAIADKEILCHIITDSILPAEQPYNQRNMLKVSIDQAMDKENKHIERIASLSGDNAGNPDRYIEDLRALMKRKQDLYTSLGYTKVRFTLACPDVKLVDKVLGSGIDIKALAFKPCDTSRFNLAQPEGIMLALRILDSGDLAKLKSVYAFLAKHPLSPEDAAITDINIFIRKVAFILPAAKVEDYELRRTNRYLAYQIWQAA
jgi:hypothetical protein